MRWSSQVVPSDEAKDSVLEFVPRKFELGTPSAALDYLKEKERGSDFNMNQAIRVQTGINAIEERSYESKIEEIVLDRLKSIQESAYSEAFSLGQEEGKQEAFSSIRQEMTEKLIEIDNLIIGINKIKLELLNQNEAYIIKLIYHFASKLAHFELKSDHNTIVNLLRETVSLSQGDENVVVRVAPDQFEFIESLKKHTERDFEFLKKIRFESDEKVSTGGCIVETNYGQVDAQLEQRTQILWDVLSEHIPKTKEKVSV